MKQIYTLKDVVQLAGDAAIPSGLAAHLERKVQNLHSNHNPDLPIEKFSLEAHGPIGILEKCDQDLTALGLPKALGVIMPEWISRLELDQETYYILYILADNDYVTQIYLPDSILAEAVRAWLAEQPVEEEGEDDAGHADEPF